MNIRYFKQNPPIELVDIKVFELTYRYKLPEDYVQFLLESNGGDVDYTHVIRYVDLHHGETFQIVNHLYGINNHEDSSYIRSLDHVNDLYLHDKDNFELPINHLVIAGLEGGHHEVLMSLNEDSYGKLYIWNYSIPDELHYLADNFTDFLQKIEWEEVVALEAINSYLDGFVATLRTKLKIPLTIAHREKHDTSVRVIDSSKYQILIIVRHSKEISITITNVETNVILFNESRNFERFDEIDRYISKFQEIVSS